MEIEKTKRIKDQAKFDFSPSQQDYKSIQNALDKLQGSCRVNEKNYIEFLKNMKEVKNRRVISSSSIFPQIKKYSTLKLENVPE